MTTRKGRGDMENNIPFKKPKLQVPPSVQGMWDDDSDDDDLILLASQAVEQNHNGPNTFSTFANDARTTSTQQHQQDSESEAIPVTVNVALRAKVTSTIALMNQDKASQDYLRRRIDGLERDVKKSKEECQAALEKFQIKDYEVSSLKYEMKEMQRANSELRLKLVKNDQSNREREENKAMTKQLQKVTTELELTRLEVLKLKSDRRMSSSQAVPMDVTISHKESATKTGEEGQSSFSLDVLTSRYEVTKADSWQFRLGHRIFENAPMDVGMGTAMFVEQLSGLQRAMGLIFQGQSMDVSQFVGHTLEGCTLALSTIAMKYDTRSRRSVLSGCDMGRLGGCIYDKESMFEEEELVIFRRILSIFALGCKFSAPLRSAFFASPLAVTLLDVLQGLARTSDDYQTRTSGIIQAGAVLLLNIVEAGDCPGKAAEPKIPTLFNALTFAHTDAFTLYTLLKILKTLDVSVARTFLCNEANEAKAYKINGDNTVHFSRDSCPLQVLATAIECAFPVAAAPDYWTIPRYRQLLAIAKCLMQFFRKGMLDVNASWLRVDRSCQCYLKLTTSFIILAHLCLHLFHTVPRLRTEMRQIHAVSQLTLLLMHDIFTTNLQMKLLYIMARPIKNRLVVVYNLLMYYNELFHFRLAQVKALESFEVNLLLYEFVKPAEGSGPTEQQRAKGRLIWDAITV